ALELRVLRNPFQNFAVAFAGFELLAQRFGISAGEVEEALIERTVVMILAVLAGDFSAALVEATRQQCVAGEPDARTARGLFGEIGSFECHGIDWVVRVCVHLPRPPFGCGGRKMYPVAGISSRGDVKRDA